MQMVERPLGKEMIKQPNVKIRKRFIGDNYPCFVTAEIGINHNGDIALAKKLIDVAVRAGCEAVKFQKRTVDAVYTSDELARLRESPFGTTNGDLKRGLEFGKKEYDEIDQYCKKQGIVWYASPWDEESVNFLEQYNPPCYKIASASLTDSGLLKHIKSKKRLNILSTGMSTMDQVVQAVAVLGEKNLILMHTVSTYPTDDHHLNLLVIQTLKKKFPSIPVGYSGHETGLSTSTMAVVLGACMVERHIAMDRTMWGSDQAASMEPRGIEILVRDIRKFEITRGDGVKRVLDVEVPIMKKLRRK